MENISEFYYEKLKSTTSPGVVLAQFYKDSLEREVGRSEIIMLNKLIKMFGRFSVFFAIMNLVNVSKLGEDFPYGLIFKICKDAIEKKSAVEYEAASSKDLTKDIDKMEEAMNKVKPAKVTKAIYEELE